jgi:DNA mismatch repair protein MutS
MKQYNAIKGKYPDALLLFRVGDFYETFGADAITASKILGITLTKRNNGAAGKTELAGFPHHALDTYLPKLVRAGQRVAICDQLEDPKKTKTIVKRGVTELVTPGVSLNDEVLEQKTNNFLACIHFEKDKAGIAFIDISTGEFLLAEGSFNYINKLIQGFSPSEIVFQKKHKELFQNDFGNSHYIYFLDEWMFTSEYANETLLKHFQTKSLKGFGIEGMDLGIIAAGVVLHYLSDTQHDQLKHVSKLSRIEEDRYVWLDKFTVRNLELLYSPNENAKTLLDVIDFTLSPMGGRLLKRWLTLPLKSKEEITKRLNIVEELCSDENLRQNIEEELNSIGDLERLISKVAVQRANPKEVYHLKNSLEILSNIKLIGEKSSKKN